jgi:hypothetical protein
MSKFDHHKVISQHWYNGALLTLENIFISLIDALSFAKSLNKHSVKIYDLDGEIVFSDGERETETYA